MSNDKFKQELYEDTINLIMIGDQFVGKTSLMKRFCENVFFQDILGTVGIECYKKIWKGSGSQYLIKIWDTCGQERFRSLTTNYYRHANGIVLVFDVNEINSFKNLINWINSINENVNVSIPIVVIANKIDLERKVNPREIRQFEKDNKFQVFESSAKSGENTTEAFNFIIKQVIQNKKKREKVKLESFDIDVIASENKCKC